MSKLICPVCGRKLPHDRHPHFSGTGEATRFRACPCGYARTERMTIEVTEFYPRHPESEPLPGAKHPAEAGDGPRSV